jgi:AraC-like DNA-binding protein
MRLDCPVSIALSNLDQVRAHLRGLLGPHELDSRDRSGEIDFWHKTAPFGEFSFNEFSYGRAMATSAQLSMEYYFLIFTVSGHISVQIGSREFLTGADTVYVVSPERFRSTLSEDCRQIVLRIGAEPLRRYLRQFYDIHVGAPLEFTPAPCLIREQTPGLQQMVAMICRELGRDATSFRDLRIRGALEQALIGVLLHEIPHNYRWQLQGGQRILVPRPVRLARDYIHSHVQEPLSVHEIAAIANVSPRALQAGFKRYLNLTPLEYLRNVRLDLAHELLTGTGGAANVTDIALRCGFSDLSKFAAYYRQRFGRHPSATLRFGRH